MLPNPQSAAAEWERLVREEERVFRETPEKSSPKSSATCCVGTRICWNGSNARRKPWPLVDPLHRTAGRHRRTAAGDGRLADSNGKPGRLSNGWPSGSGTVCGTGRPELPAGGGPAPPGPAGSGRTDVQQALQIRVENHLDHTRTAFALQERGLFDWAEREYRRVDPSRSARRSARCASPLAASGRCSTTRAGNCPRPRCCKGRSTPWTKTPKRQRRSCSGRSRSGRHPLADALLLRRAFPGRG